MDQFTYSTNLLNHIKSLHINEKIGEWEFKGKTDQVFSTPGGKWPADGYLFEKLDGKYKFVIRSFPKDNASYIVLESINLGRQLYNINLSDKKTFSSTDGKTRLLESYNMTVGKGRKKSKDVEEEFKKGGVKSNLISEIDDNDSDWTQAVIDILQGAINREIVKKSLQNNTMTLMSNKNYRKPFKGWLTKNYNDKNGTNASYIRAIDIISEITKQDIFEVDDIEYLNKLYQNTLEEQKKNNSKYFYAEAPSYGKKGFYSASLKTYIQYLQSVTLAINKKIMINSPLNQILYGPPGTGKTYATINKAISIIENKFEEDIYKEDRLILKKRFDGYIDSKQIVFTTFHQSMSYEDFIEGIKPDVKEGNVIYDTIPGIFVELCNKARDDFEASTYKNNSHLPFEVAFTKLKDEWEEDETIKFPLKTKGKDYTIIGFTNKSIQFKKASGGTNHTLSINTLKEHYYNKREIKKSGVGIYYPAILEKLYSYPKESTSSNSEISNFVIIIDEINRGNISQIFGELITLIEDSKRLGNNESLEIMLPYSKEKFSVPKNLYIIGTMNTADRSIEALDTALRRRFNFEEMPPKDHLLSPSEMYCRLLWKYRDVGWDDAEFVVKENDLFTLLGVSQELKDEREVIWEQMKRDKNESIIKNDYFEKFKYEGVNLKKLLNTINNRIEILLDRDHTIGHSYFIGVNSVEELNSVFKNNILPLLQEYFFGNYEKIALILGEGFVECIEANENKVKFAKWSSTNMEAPEINRSFRLKNNIVNIEDAIKELFND